MNPRHSGVLALCSSTIYTWLHTYNPVSPHTRSGIVSVCVCVCTHARTCKQTTVIHCTPFNLYHVSAGMAQST